MSGGAGGGVVGEDGVLHSNVFEVMVFVVVLQGGWVEVLSRAVDLAVVVDGGFGGRGRVGGCGHKCWSQIIWLTVTN
ncbi:Hypothetical predicted protein [Olea europaea subsp. europaea]|uniref:Uncharacterized protein n=1 Tax=Olea europaea subsp. europaea TaxID=158383 RepID=A0A8S0UNK9_OLEEU|nr:Hypothetical predicted protein [Olea europaea subsp. europaea]